MPQRSACTVLVHTLAKDLRQHICSDGIPNTNTLPNASMYAVAVSDQHQQIRSHSTGDGKAVNVDVGALGDVAAVLVDLSAAGLTWGMQGHWGHTLYHPDDLPYASMVEAAVQENEGNKKEGQRMHDKAANMLREASSQHLHQCDAGPHEREVASRVDVGAKRFCTFPPTMTRFRKVISVQPRPVCVHNTFVCASVHVYVLDLSYARAQLQTLLNIFMTQAG